MRAILLVLILVVVALLAAVGSGFVNIHQTRPAKVPDVSAAKNGVTAKGGQTPAFDVQTGSVKVGVQDKNVKVPTVNVQPPADKAQTNAQ